MTDAVAVTTMAAGHRLALDLRSPAQRDAFVSGRFDDGLISALRRLTNLEPQSVMVDVGANVGLWTVPLALYAAAAGASVAAFEPQPDNAARLRSNVALNDVDDVVTVHEVGLSAVAERRPLTRREDFDSGATTGNAAIHIPDGQDDALPADWVDLMPLDACAATFAGPAAALKIDVEGYEHLVLRGARDTLARDRPPIVLEWNPVYHLRRGDDATTQLEQAVAGLDYRALRESDGAWRAEPTIESPKDFDNLILVPDARLADALAVLNRS